MKQALVLLSLLAVMLVGSVAAAAPVFKDEDKGIVVNVGVLLQPQFQMTMPGSDGAGPGACGSALRNRCSAGIGNARGDGPAEDFFLRRARLMIWGSATKEISYFAETDEPNLGKGGNFNTAAGSAFSFIQDAFLTYSFNPLFRIDAGLLLIPLSHHTLEGATSLNALDYHTDEIRFPTGRAFRDTGIQFRGLAAQDHFHYRLSITEGVRNGALAVTTAGAPAPAHSILNPGSVPRFTLQLRGNIIGSEPDFFFKGIYFSEKPIVSVGLGTDWQSEAVFKIDHHHGDYIAMSGDVFVEWPFTPKDEIIFKGNYFFYGEGNDSISGPVTVNGAATTSTVAVPGATNVVQGSNAAYAELGFRHDFIEPLAYMEVFKARKDAQSIIAPHVGVNFWVLKHNFNVKTDLGYKRTEVKAEPPKKDILWTTQAQLFF
ncbi:MAG TPA: porin [Polyangiaceae bacterium]|nr:porin [Polyangiaceae bacterium]